MLIRVAFITNLVYFMLLFKSNPKCEEIFFHILARTHCAIYKCFYFYHHITHTHKSNVEYIGKRKLFLTHVGDLFAS